MRRRFKIGPEGSQALFAGRVLPFDEKAALVWARLMAEGKTGGRSPSAFDMMVAAVIGSAILNIVAKNHYARLRPNLWLSITPETTFSFPSGHATGSMTFAMAGVILCWPTRARFPTLVVSAIFVLVVGISRLYLGVHYPSDILSGWTAAIAWTFGRYSARRKSPTQVRPCGLPYVHLEQDLWRG